LWNEKSVLLHYELIRQGIHRAGDEEVVLTFFTGIFPLSMQQSMWETRKKCFKGRFL